MPIEMNKYYFFIKYTCAHINCIYCLHIFQIFLTLLKPIDMKNQQISKYFLLIIFNHISFSSSNSKYQKMKIKKSLNSKYRKINSNIVWKKYRYTGVQNLPNSFGIPIYRTMVFERNVFFF